MNATQAALTTERDRIHRRFAAAAAHELRTPLTGLRAELEEARLHPGQTDLPRLLDAALRGVERLEAITDDLLLLTRVAEATYGRQQPVDLSAVARAHVAETAKTAKTAEGPDIRLRAAAPVVVDAVPALLDRLVANLLDNARRCARHSIQLQVRRHESTAELVVADDGPGIPVSDRERVFECFSRLDSARCRQRGGTGLGLAIARDIAHAHSGTLDVEDADAGARFVLRLPLARHAAGRP
ncbi:HAMP domain-containing sensor histidine kinase [Streptosporangium sp. NPDC023963]|uniref:sensor histidine kinase n=1 Tax=Streptosporangium sp. NPDC023963 TaxID=3155608 RepID=UPI003431F463